MTLVSLIIEDDPMVAMLNDEFLRRIVPEAITHTAKTLSEARHILGEHQVDIMLVDVYLPDGTGLDFLDEVYQSQRIPSILITAANDGKSVEKSLELGVEDYLIKPFKFERFQLAVAKVLELQQLKGKSNSLNQTELDQYFNHVGKREHPVDNGEKADLPKGLTPFTLNRVGSVLLSQCEFLSTKELSEQMDISRITIKKYIDYLLELDLVDEEISYLEQGRPLTKYRLKEGAGEHLKKLT